MARRQTFLPAHWSSRFAASYRKLRADQQRSCDKVLMRLIKGEASAGLHIKPILPDKHYYEARLNSGDRVIFRIEGDVIRFVDVVTHDEIGRYGRR
jgi:Txe/YoeB family toxin of Txe-Axe toxin-antitoxin module